MDGMNNLAGGDEQPDERAMEARVAVLEEIAAGTKQGMAEMRHDIQDLRASTNRRIDALRDALERDFWLLFGALIAATLGLAALMAKGFHWF